MEQVHKVPSQLGRVGAANAVTALRGVLAVAVALLAIADRAPAMVALAAVALVLDGVDGQVARRTGTVTAFGARFDLEVDAFLILVLSAYVAWTTAWWVLAIGLARYAFVAAKAVLPRLRGSAPPRYWCKVVAAVQGVVLTVVVADLLPRSVELGALALALALLAESFGREAWQLWTAGEAPAAGTRRGITIAAVLLVWVALVAPDDLSELTPARFARIPLEALVLVALALVLPPRGRRTAAVVFGVALGLVVVVKALDLGFHAVLDRPFEPLSDWTATSAQASACSATRSAEQGRRPWPSAPPSLSSAVLIADAACHGQGRRPRRPAPAGLGAPGARRRRGLGALCCGRPAGRVHERGGPGRRPGRPGQRGPRGPRRVRPGDQGRRLRGHPATTSS